MVFYGYGRPPSSSRLDIEEHGLIVEDDEGWGMAPGPNFGCILHDEK